MIERIIMEDAEEVIVTGDLTPRRLRWLEHAGLQPLSGTALRLAILLALRFVSLPKSKARFHETGRVTAWPNQNTLAEHLGCTRQNIGKAARQLVKEGLLEIKPAAGRGKAIEYRLVEKSNTGLPISGARKGNQQDRKGQLDGRKRATTGAKNGNTELPHSHSSVPYKKPSSYIPSSGEYSFASQVRGKMNWKRSLEVFDEIYELWPKKKGKELPKGAWIKNIAKAGIDPDKVLESANDWCETWRNQKKPFIIFLGKWIKEGWWEIDPADHFEAARDAAAVRRYDTYKSVNRRDNKSALVSICDEDAEGWQAEETEDDRDEDGTKNKQNAKRLSRALEKTVDEIERRRRKLVYDAD